VPNHKQQTVRMTTSLQNVTLLTTTKVCNCCVLFLTTHTNLQHRETLRFCGSIL